MDTIEYFTLLFGGQFMILNVFLLILTFFFISSVLKNNYIRIVFSVLAAIIIDLQITSLYYTQTFINYQFYIHSNTRDILGMINLYYSEIGLLFIFLILFISLFYFSNKLAQATTAYLCRFSFFNKNKYKNITLKSTKILIVGSCIMVMNFDKGVINEALDFYYILQSSTNSNRKGFDSALDQLKMEDYISSENIEATKGKNIIIISLESFEKGYLSEKFADLTPNLRSLKEKWTYNTIKPNEGSSWTSGSLYTCLTGFPAFFGVDGNAIFQTAHHSEISSIGNVFEKAGYKTTFLIENARFSGTQEMLHTFKIDNIIDKELLGGKARDKDLFDRAKLEIQSNVSNKNPFVIFISTVDTHFPDGILDERMKAFVSPKKSDLEFMVSAVDYLVGDFVHFLDKQNLLSNTVVYIFPDHLKMGDPSLFDGTGERGLYLISNAPEKDISVKDRDNLYQIDLAKMILKGALIQNNEKFMTDYLPKKKDLFIQKNVNLLTSVNSSGLMRFYSNKIRDTKDDED